VDATSSHFVLDAAPFFCTGSLPRMPGGWVAMISDSKLLQRCDVSVLNWKNGGKNHADGQVYKT
jgi:hypothetical protein